MEKYFITPKNIDNDIYITVEEYFAKIIPKSCI